MRHQTALLAAAAIAAAAVSVVGVARADGTADTQAKRLDNAQQVTDTLPPPPKPYVWMGPLPAGAPWGIPCNREQATITATAMFAVGGDNSDVEKMLAVFGRESGCRYWVHNYNRATSDDSYSLCQLNALSGHFGPRGVMYGWDRWAMLDSFDYAARACAYMWSQCGFGPWVKPYGCRKP